MILAFDPGVNTGWAVLDTRADRYGMLIACGLIEFFESFAMRVFPVFSSLDMPQKLVIEKPQVYRSGLQRGSQEDIVDTAFRAGVLCARTRAYFGVAFFPGGEFYPSPRDWKGTVPKDVHNRRVLGKLSDAERTLVPKLSKTKLHNVVDAIGLACWAVGR